MSKVRMDIDDGNSHRGIEVDFPGNSMNKNADVEQIPEKKEKIISGKVVKRKKSFSRKLVETFVGEDVVDVKSYVIHDIAVPALKNMVADMFRDIPELLFFQGRRTSSNSSWSNGRDRGRSSIRYDKPDSRERDRREISNRGRASHNFDEIILESRGEADYVLDQLCELIDKYKEATVSDLYDYLGITSNYTDRSYGWVNLNSARVAPVRGGYMLDLPRPIVLK